MEDVNMYPTSSQNVDSAMHITPPAVVDTRMIESKSKMAVVFSYTLAELENKAVVIQSLNPQHVDSFFCAPSGKSLAHEIHNGALTMADEAAKPDPKRSFIVGMDMSSCHNDLGCPVKFSVTGQHRNSEMTDNHGNTFPIMVWNGERTRGNMTEIYNSREMLNDPFLLRYGACTTDKLWSECVTFPGDEMVYVPVDHYSARLIQLNPGKFGPAITANDLREDGKYFRLNGKFVGKAINELYTNIISKFNYTDLSEFKISMARQDNRPFDHKAGTSVSNMSDAEFESYKNKTFHAGFELHVTWASQRKQD